MIGIYKITNTITGKYYIGSSKNIKDRIYRHFVALRNNKHKNKHLQASYNKYGWRVFESELVEECSLDKLVEREQFYLEAGNWSNMYNQTRIAYGGGSDVTTIEHVLLNLEGAVVDRFYSGRDLGRFLKSTQHNLYNVNTPQIVCKMYRIVTLEFFENNIDVIYSWPNSDEL